MPAAVPRIAVLLAAYNGVQWLDAQLASLQGQHDVAVSIFISVDQSTDDTQSWCERYAAAFTNVRVLPSLGRFGGAGKNFYRLIRDVQFDGFDYVAFSDQDDVWHHDKLARAAHLLASGHYSGYSSNVTAFWPDGREALIQKAQPQVQWDYLFEAAGPGCTYVISASFASQLKAILTERWDVIQRVTLHDWLIYALARSQGRPWYIDPIPGLNYRQHDRNQVGANRGLKPLLSRLKIIRDGWWLEQIRLITEISGQPWPLLAQLPKHPKRCFLALVLHARQCRRRRRDQLFFAFLCLGYVVVGRSNGE
ncbi:glycosyltransferase [Pseudomonas putida]